MSQNSSFQLDLIVPCYNPLKYWELNFINKFQSLEKAIGVGLIKPILINDGTTNGRVSDIEISKLRSEIPHLEYINSKSNRGKGSALRLGVESAKSDFCVFTDIDFPYRLESIISVYDQLKKGSDVVLGFREQEYYENVPASRRVLSKTLRWLLKRVLRLPITDTQCGLKGFNKKGEERLEVGGVLESGGIGGLSDGKISVG